MSEGKNPFTNFFQSFFRQPAPIFDPGNQPGKTYDTTLFDGYIADGRYDPFLYDDKLRQLYRPEGTGLAITDILLRQIDDLIVNDPLIGMCYEKLVTLSDTDFKIKLELSSQAKEEEILKVLSEQLPKYFPCCSTLRDISYLIISKIIAHGLFACQVIPNDNLVGVKEITVPTADTIKWMRSNDKWILIQHFKGQIIPINTDNFIYQPLFFIQNNYGIWVIPLFKAALKPAYAYRIFCESLVQIARRTGVQKVLNATFVSPDSVKQASPSTEEGKRLLREFQYKMSQFANTIRETLPNSIVAHPDDIILDDLATIEPSETLTTFHDLLANQVIMGAKLYPSLIGIIGRENQTTLSNNQKMALKSLITTIQVKADIALKEMIQQYLILNNVVFKSIEIERIPPQLETNLEDAQAKEVELRNKGSEMDLENREKGGKTIDSEGDVQKKAALQGVQKKEEQE